MSSKPKKKKQVRNRSKDVLADYYKTNKAYEEENRRRQQEEGTDSKGLKNLNTFEKTCVAIIVLGVIGCIVKYIIL